MMDGGRWTVDGGRWTVVYPWSMVYRLWSTHGLLVVLCLVACSAVAPDEEHHLTFRRVVDLSHVIRGDMPHLPGHPLTDLAPEVASAGRYVTQMGLHSGTSLLIAGSIEQNQPGTADLLPADLVIPAVVLDMRDQAQDQADYRLRICDILAWERQHGQIPPDALVLLVTGWDLRWGSHDEYLNLQHGQVHVPGFGAAAVAWLVQHRAIRGVGLDAPGGNMARDIALIDHSTTVRTQYLLLENLTSLEQVPPVGAMLLVGVLKVEASAVAPARVLALVP